MSHSVETKFDEFRNLETLSRAFALKNWKIVQNSRIRTYRSDPSRNKTFAYVAVNPGTGDYAYDIGINVGADGRISLECDYSFGNIHQTWHNPTLEHGDVKGNYGLLIAAYNAENTRPFIEARGGSMLLSFLANGTIDASIEVPVEVETVL